MVAGAGFAPAVSWLCVPPTAFAASRYESRLCGLDYPFPPLRRVRHLVSTHGSEVIRTLARDYLVLFLKQGLPRI